MLTRYVTLSLGERHDLTARAHVALLAAMAWAPEPAEFCIVTDRPDLFAWFGDRLRILTVDSATLQHWRGKHDFFWRVELMTVVHTAAQGPANVVYIDSDVLVRTSLADVVAELESGSVFMHLLEQDLALAKRSGDRRLWSMLHGREFAGVRFQGTCPMWNAGLIAVGSANHGVLSQALTLLDALMDAGVKHTLVEQLAISTAFQATGRLRAGDAWMDHFWCNKVGYGREIDRQLAEIWYRRMDVITAIAYVRSNPIIRPLVVRRRWWNRLFRPFAGVDD